MNTAEKIGVLAFAVVVVVLGNVAANRQPLPPGHTAEDMRQEESAAEYLRRIDAENGGERNAMCRQDGQEDTVSIQLNIEFDCYAIEAARP